MELYIDPSQRRGLAGALFEQLRAAIVSGRLRHGDRLPPSRDLAGELGISRHTVTTAYSRLVAEGFLEGRTGGGTRVAYAVGSVPGVDRPASLRPRTMPARSATSPSHHRAGASICASGFPTVGSSRSPRGADV